jgi:hypothetical protein
VDHPNTSNAGTAAASTSGSAGTSPAAGAAPVVLQAIELKGAKPAYVVTLTDHGLSLAPAGDGEPLDVPHAERGHRIVCERGLMIPPRFFWVETDKKKRRGFQLPDDAQLEALQKWIGPPTHEGLRAELKRAFYASLPIGIMFVVTSLPSSGDPAKGIAAVPMDWLGLWLGGSLIVLAPTARRFPHRGFFVLNALWMLVLAGELVHRFLSGSSGAWWLLLLVFHYAVIASSLRAYRKFAPERMAPS